MINEEKLLTKFKSLLDWSNSFNEYSDNPENKFFKWLCSFTNAVSYTHFSSSIDPCDNFEVIFNSGEKFRVQYTADRIINSKFIK